MCNLQFTLRNVHSTCVHCKIYIVHSASVHSTLFWYSVYCTLYSRPHKLFGHSRVFILTIMICVKRIIFSNDCISKRLKDRKLKLFS